jgi:hypothetical protein
VTLRFTPPSFFLLFFNAEEIKMPKLNQIIAIVNGKKSQAESEITTVHHKVQKTEMLTGITRTYRPLTEEGEKFPSEAKLVQYTAKQAIAEASAVLADLITTVAIQDVANCEASANVVVDGKMLLADVPVTHMLFLEKQLIDIHTFVDKIPTLDPAETWEHNGAAGTFATPPFETAKTKKIPRNHVKAEATEHHPAQVELFHEDVVVGYWSTKKFSGAIPASEKNAILGRIRNLQKAVKFAREEANAMEVTDVQYGKEIMEYIFGKSTA